MRVTFLVTTISGILFFFAGPETYGQLTVQQPIFQSTGGQFAVSVPDRGGVLLGSVSRAGESRNSYGFPFTRGSSVGRFARHSSLSSHVWIQDLREMDRLILQMAETDPQGLQPSSSAAAGRAGIAWSDDRPRRGVSIDDRLPTMLRTRPLKRAGLNDFDRNPAPETGRSVSRPPRLSPALDPARNYRLGMEAEESGKLTLAKLHYQTAAQYGSDEAARRLRQMTSRPVVAR